MSPIDLAIGQRMVWLCSSLLSSALIGKCSSRVAPIGSMPSQIAWPGQHYSISRLTIDNFQPDLQVDLVSDAPVAMHSDPIFKDRDADKDAIGISFT